MLAGEEPNLRAELTATHLHPLPGVGLSSGNVPRLATIRKPISYPAQPVRPGKADDLVMCRFARGAILNNARRRGKDGS